MRRLTDELVEWLLAGDPSIVWQTERDLLRAPAPAYERTRQRIGTEGWGRELLSFRADEGTWGGGLYWPQWTSTFYSLRLLYWLGLDGSHPQAVETCSLLLDEGVEPDGGVRLWAGPAADCCVTAMLLGMAMHFGHSRDERVDVLADWLVAEQLEDGGWNCNAGRSGCRVSSFHTTRSTLEGLHDYGQSTPDCRARVTPALESGREYFLRHRVFRSERTGRIVKDSFTRFSFPPRWYFDVLRALDHFRAAAAAWDRRLEDAIELVLKREDKDGRWRNQNHHPGREFFSLEKTGAASRWNTLRALRVLEWAGR